MTSCLYTRVVAAWLLLLEWSIAKAIVLLEDNNIVKEGLDSTITRFVLSMNSCGLKRSAGQSTNCNNRKMITSVRREWLGVVHDREWYPLHVLRYNSRNKISFSIQHGDQPSMRTTECAISLENRDVLIEFRADHLCAFFCKSNAQKDIKEGPIAMPFGRTWPTPPTCWI